MEKQTIAVGFKNNALGLVTQLINKNVGGYSDGIHHSSVLMFTKSQFEELKVLIKVKGYSINKSLIKNTNKDSRCDYSCYLIRK